MSTSKRGLVIKRLTLSLVLVGLVISGCALSYKPGSGNQNESGDREGVSASPQAAETLEMFSLLDSSTEEFKAEAQRSCEGLLGETGKPKMAAAQKMRVEIAKRAALVVDEMRGNSSFDSTGFNRTEIETVLVLARAELEDFIAQECGIEELLTESDETHSNPQPSPALTDNATEPQKSGRTLSSAPDALLKDCLRYSLEYSQGFARGRPDYFVASEWFGHTETILITGAIPQPVYRSKSMASFWDNLVIQEGPNGVAETNNLLAELQAFCLVTTGIDITK